MAAGPKRRVASVCHPHTVLRTKAGKRLKRAKTVYQRHPLDGKGHRYRSGPRKGFFRGVLCDPSATPDPSTATPGSRTAVPPPPASRGPEMGGAVPGSGPPVLGTNTAASPGEDAANRGSAPSAASAVPRRDPPLLVGAAPALYDGPFGRREADRLLWRAGFGPAPGQSEALVRIGLEAAVASLTRPEGAPRYAGPEPRTAAGGPLAPADASGHDHLHWLDRMVRGDQPLLERMALIWHDWFATSNADVGDQELMLDQYELFRRHWLGNFAALVSDVTRDPAMLLWLNGNQNQKAKPDENYARELMELFTLGADRGAYSEGDVRELARALTGWRNSTTPELGAHNFRFDPARWDSGQKTVFGRTGAWNWEDAGRLCLEHPLHASFLVGKLWGAFIPTPPSEDTRAQLEALYLSSYEIRLVVEAILVHPDLYLGAPLVLPPVVFCAGALRALGAGIETTAWTGLCFDAGQRLFHPPNVSGWDDERWLDTSTFRGRWRLIGQALTGRSLDPNGPYDATETPEAALESALAHWGGPRLSPESEAALLDFARTCLPLVMTAAQHRQNRIYRQNALRQLVAASPDRLVG